MSSAQDNDGAGAVYASPPSRRFEALKGALGVCVGAIVVAGIYVVGYWDGVGHDTNLGLALLAVGAVVAIAVLIVGLWRAAR